MFPSFAGEALPAAQAAFQPVTVLSRFLIAEMTHVLPRLVCFRALQGKSFGVVLVRHFSGRHRETAEPSAASDIANFARWSYQASEETGSTQSWLEAATPLSSSQNVVVSGRCASPM